MTVRLLREYRYRVRWWKMHTERAIGVRLSSGYVVLRLDVWCWYLLVTRAAETPRDP